MEVYRRSSWLVLIFGLTLLAVTLQGVQGQAESEGPSESECRPYIEKALKELETGDTGSESKENSVEDIPTVEITTDDSVENEGNADEEPNLKTDDDDDNDDDSKENADDDSRENAVEEEKESEEAIAEEKSDSSEEDSNKQQEDNSKDDSQSEEQAKQSEETDDKDDTGEEDSKEAQAEDDSKEDDSKEANASGSDSKEDDGDSKETASKEDDSKEADDSAEADKNGDSKEDNDKDDSKEGAKVDSKEDDSKEGDKDDSNEDDSKGVDSKEDDSKDDSKEDASKEDSKESAEGAPAAAEADSEEDKVEKRSIQDVEGTDSKESEESNDHSEEKSDKKDVESEEEKSGESKDDDDDENSGESDEDSGEPVEEDLTQETDIPTELRSRDHVEQLLKLDDESLETEKIISRVADITLRDLKRLYENAIKPLEVVYKYRDLSNRHFGDSEIFSKPLVLFMGPWSGGKSTIINYLVDNEYNETSLRTGAEPSPAYFNILMHGEEPEVLDGTQLAADFTFSGLQKFGQGLEERLRGQKLPSKLLQKINIVEIPGILEVRKQISRLFPFNDACQWFIDRADIIFLVYDPSKLDVGPETEAILDQLKGREHQTRIVLNKADQVKPEELMRVQGALIWNISPLMSSAQPPIMYSTSLWSRPYEPWAPVRLLQAQERAFLRDLRTAYDKRIENKIASARRFAVRVRNHAKMVDCYLTTYYNHKSVFGNRKQVADLIIEHPQDYHIYEGLSTLTNISRYDLPDPDVYRDFFRLNPLYDFQQLSATCTYFRGCPINRLDVAIAYDLPELVGKHKRMVESALVEAQQASPPDS